MATYDELIAAARRADAAGDEAAARRFLELAAAATRGTPRNQDGTYGQPPEGVVMNPATGQMEDLRSPANPNVPQGRGAAAALGGMQGLGYDFGDEVVGGIGALTGQGAEYSRELMREGDARARDEFPFSYGVPKVAGAVASSLSLGRGLGITAAPTTAGRAAQGAGIGAGEGALFGFGQGEGAADRVAGAMQFGALGGLLGGAAPFAVDAVRRGYDGLIAGPVASMRAAPSQVRADRAVAGAAQRAGLTADDLDAALQQAAREGQPEFVTVDALGRPGQRMLSSIQRTPTEAQQDIVEFLTSRQDQQGRRVGGFISEALDAPDTAAARTASLTQARGAAADAAYTAARQDAGPVDVRAALSVIDERIGGMQGSGVAGDGIDGALARFRGRLAAQPGPDGVMRELSDFDRVLGVKQDVSDAIGAAVRAGRNNEARELTKLRDALDAALEASSPSYRTANDQFRQASRVIDAVDEGTQAARPRNRADDVLAQYQAMTPEQQAAFRVGYADPVMARVENAPLGTNRVRTLRADGFSDVMGGIANDPALLARRLDREARMFSTNQGVLGGSQTAERLADDALLSSESVGILGNILAGRFGAAAGQAGIMAGNSLAGRNTATREEIARILLSRDPRAALERALAAETTAAGKAAIMDAVIRSLPRPVEAPF